MTWSVLDSEDELFGAVRAAGKGRSVRWSSQLWVCIDCYDEVHGIGDGRTTLHDEYPRARYWLDSGLINGCNCNPDLGCDCDTVDFSRASCEGCQSGLAGSRHAIVVTQHTA